MNHSIGINDFNSICRICLVKKDDMITFFSPMIVYMLEYCTSVEETSNKKLPQQICADCYERLKNAFHFKEQYLLSIEILRGIVVESDKWIKNEDNIEIKDEESVEKETKIESETEDINENPIVEVNIKEEPSIPIETNATDEPTKCDSDSERSSNNSSTEEIFRKIEETITRRKKRKGKLFNSEYACDVCGKKIKRQNYLRHRSSHSNVRPYECDICHLKFNRQFTLVKHKEVMHENKKNTRKELCFICGKFFSQTLTIHLLTHKQQSENERFECDKCNRVYNREKTLRIHIREKHSEEIKRYPCKMCDKSFVCKSSLKPHIRLKHSSEKIPEHACTLCDKSYKKKSQLNSHVKTTHLGERPHSCSVCDKTFYTKVILENHMRTHTGERPFTCTVCGKSFSFTASLRTHMKVHSK